MIPIVSAIGEKCIEASGSIGSKIRIIPYVANFSTKPASTILPETGASVWAFTNQRWKGTSGVLIAKDKKIASHRIFCCSNERSAAESTSKFVLPTV